VAAGAEEETEAEQEAASSKAAASDWKCEFRGVRGMKLRSAGAGVALLDGVAPAALERGAEESLPERLPPAPAVVPPPPRTNICDASPATSMKDSSIPELGLFSVPKKVEKVRGSLERDSENKNSPMRRKGFLPSFSRV
jgi:hypothetical protein